MAYTSIDNPADYFEVIGYAGDGNTTQAITANFQADLSWIKHRSTTAAHTIQDSLRGFNAANKLSSNSGDVENDSSGATWENYGHVSAVSSSSFTVTRGANTPYQTNASSVNYIAWHWKESATAGFDIVGYTGNATADQDHSHSLSAVPHVIIVKNRTNTNDESWAVYHHKNTSSPETDRLYLNSTGATGDDTEFWQDSVPTSSVFTIGRQDTVNGSSNTHIAYLWSEKQGYSKFGTYDGNNNANGTFVYTGFRPAFLMIKRPDSGGDNWPMHDIKRAPYNPMDESLYANTNGAEITTRTIDFLSNGFKMRNTMGDMNGTNPFIYMAFAEAPFVNSKGVPCNAR